MGVPSKAVRGTVIVAVVQDPGASRRGLLERVLAESGFWRRLVGLRRGGKRAAADLRILIKPDLTVFDQASPTGTDPRLVEHLIDLLHDRGYANVAVADASGRADLWCENREVPVLAELAGYRYVTDAGRAYDVVDLSEDLTDLPARAGGVLGGSPIARGWLEADVRIGFASSKTDEEEGYALGLQNLLGALPLRDKTYHYRHRLPAPDVARDLLALAPPHFALIDAFESNHGPAGSRRVDPLPTRTLIASRDVLLADWVGALKMGLDPYVSRLHAELLRAGGLPRAYKVVGSCAPYPGWRNVPTLLRESVRARNASPGLAEAVEPWLQRVDPELFPLRSELDERLNALLAGLTTDLTDRPLAVATLTAVNFWLGGLARAAENWRLLADKDSLRRRTTALGFEPGAWPPAEYEAVVDYMQPLAELAAETPPDRNGLRWRYLDASVLFHFRQVVERPYDEFVARVEIARAVQTMNDYLGGARLPLTHDRTGRVTRQAERNLYLPQPNWTVLFGGVPIDVGKLEVVRYQADQQQIFWRTVVSANGSAEFDDGIITFARTAADQTAVTIVARQKFALPPALDVLHLERFPQVKDALVSDAYTTYLARTVANFVAVYEGRDGRLGRAWDPVRGEPDTPGERGPVALVVEAVRQLAVLLEPWLARKVTAAPEAVDDAGFRHFPGPSATTTPGGPAAMVATFLGELATAFQKDLALRGGRP
jgi:uncharacterized protein (DUF362 family)